MSNHIHLIVTSRSDVRKECGAAEIACRCLKLCPEQHDEISLCEAPALRQHEEIGVPEVSKVVVWEEEV